MKPQLILFLLTDRRPRIAVVLGAIVGLALRSRTGADPLAEMWGACLVLAVWAVIFRALGLLR